jgi:hypothetical protein
VLILNRIFLLQENRQIKAGNKTGKKQIHRYSLKLSTAPEISAGAKVSTFLRLSANCKLHVRKYLHIVKVPRYLLAYGRAGG